MKTQICIILFALNCLLVYSQSSNETENSTTTSINDDITVTLSLGSNLDLAEGLKLNSFYGRLSAVKHNFLQSQKGWIRKNVLSKMGIYGAVYQNNYITENKQELPPAYYYSFIQKQSPTEFQFERSYSKIKIQKTYKNVGLILTFPFNITNHNRQINDPINNFFFTPLDFEAVLTRETINGEYNTLYKDTIVTANFKFDSLLTEYKQSKDFVDYYWNFTNFQYLFKGNDYEVFIKMTPLSLNWKGGEARSHTGYGFYFGVIEKSFNIRIGGEFKGVYGDPNPFYNLFITKSFKLNKFGKLFKETD